MEGREPPPRATHPFDNDPKYNKFWGTQTGKGFFKFASVGMSIWIGLLCINMYLTRNEGTRALGFIKIATPEERELRKEKLRVERLMKTKMIPATLENTDGFESMRADGTKFIGDGIKFLTDYKYVDRIRNRTQPADPSHVHD